MKMIRLFAILNIMGLIWICMAGAEQNTITLPKGTKVEKLGPGHYRFILPTIEVRDFNPKTGTVGKVSIIDPQPPGKPISMGNKGSFKTSKKLTKKEVVNMTPENYVMIDDEPTWLPASISIIDPEPPDRPVNSNKIK
ncbi:MAG: hypothetical protein N3D17_06505 [bacterium]|nr:hypothetical protein [bacterium]